MNTKPSKKPELMAPAGDWPSLVSAVDSGADAVYFGSKQMNMRAAAENFDILELSKVMRYLHERGRKGYLALNTIIYDRELPAAERLLRQAGKAGVDGVIAWDMSVVVMAQKFKIPVHLSTQASVSNFSAVKYYARAGINRIVLARECSLADVKAITDRIRKSRLDCGIEVFIHGALCVSISGRCYFSGHFFGESANRGKCFQPCRREFLIKDAARGDEYILGKDYVLSAKDLCTIDFIDKLIDSGACAFKIEGRMRSPEYSSIVTSVYRRAIDAYFEGRLTVKLKKTLRGELEKVFSRGFETGLYLGRPKDIGSSKGAHGYEKIYAGEVTNYYSRIGVAEVRLSNSGISTGDQILVFGKTTPASFFFVSELQVEHKAVVRARKGELAGIKLGKSVRPKDKLFLVRNKPA